MKNNGGTMKKFYEYEIRYFNNKNGEQTSEIEYSKLYAIKKYIELLTSDLDISNLAIYRNAIDITANINKYLMK